MRDIKFRMIFQSNDEPSEMYFHVFTFGELVGGKAKHRMEHLGHRNIAPIARDQWTGLVDKDGKEIYEGDVVEHESWDSTLTVEFNTNMGGWYLMQDGSGIQWHSQTVRIVDGRKTLPFLTITGNIHQEGGA